MVFVFAARRDTDLENSRKHMGISINWVLKHNLAIVNVAEVHVSRPRQSKITIVLWRSYQSYVAKGYEGLEHFLKFVHVVLCRFKIRMGLIESLKPFVVSLFSFCWITSGSLSFLYGSFLGRVPH